MNGYFRYFCVFGVFILLTACGGSSSTSGSGSGSGSEGSSSSDSGFRVQGTLPTSLVSSSLSSGDFATTETSSNATDILAVSPTTGSVTCQKITLESDGTFDFRLTSKKPWFFYFFNRFGTGRGMFFGRFKSSTLDTLVPGSSTGSINLGTLTFDEDDKTLTPEVDHEDLIESLEIDSETADEIGDVDDMARRYANPDIDGDGQIDCDQSNRNFFLDFHVRFSMKSDGSDIEVNDIIDAYYPEATTEPEYQSTGIYLAYSNSFSSETTGNLKFVDSDVTTSEGGSLTANTNTSDVTANAFGDYLGYGANLTSASELPTGEIVFTFGDKELTFSDVQTPTLASLTEPAGRLFPFVKFNKTDSECTSDCTLASISYKWMKKTASAWTEATLEEIEILVEDDTPYLSFRVDGDESATVGFTLPHTSLSGTLDWDSDNATLTGVTAGELDALTTDQICHIGLSFDDKLGMRYFQNILNSNGDCES